MQLGKILIFLGVICIIVGGLFIYRDQIPYANMLGQLPGDIVIKREGSEIHFPIVTCLIVSAAVSLILRLLR